MYIKLCIVNKLLLVREDLVVEYVMEIMDKIFDKEEERLEKLEELDRCRKLRLLHIYCEQLN